jgi:hypothetical protein
VPPACEPLSEQTSMDSYLLLKSVRLVGVVIFIGNIIVTG